jgi:hypothetical protein
MITITRALAAGVVLAGAAVGLAGPASAQLDEGSYTWTVSGGSAGFTGVHSQWVLTPCGQACITVQFSNGTTTDVHLQGSTWTGVSANGCTETIDNNSLAGHNDCPGSSTEFQLTKNS